MIMVNTNPNLSRCNLHVHVAEITLKFGMWTSMHGRVHVPTWEGSDVLYIVMSST